MVTAQILVHNHVLYNQSMIISELMKSGTISEEWFYDEEDEVIEWWLVTPFLAEQLKEEDEIVVEEMDCYWWGRTMSGQAIYMDAVMANICQSLN